VKTLALFVTVLSLTSCRPTHATWDGERFSCPVNTAIWASEQEAAEGKDNYVYCIEVN